MNIKKLSTGNKLNNDTGWFNVGDVIKEETVQYYTVKSGDACL